MKENYELMEKFSDLIWGNYKITDREKDEIDFFNIRSTSYEDAIFYDDICIYSSDCDRGWNDEKDNYERTIEEQCICELEKWKEKIEKVLLIIKGDK